MAKLYIEHDDKDAKIIFLPVVFSFDIVYIERLMQ